MSIKSEKIQVNQQEASSYNSSFCWLLLDSISNIKQKTITKGKMVGKLI